MTRSRAAAIIEARSYLAALAAVATTTRASAEYQRLLLQINRLHEGPATAANTVPGFSHELLFDLTTAAVEELTDRGIDLLTVELLLDDLEHAWISDVP